MYIKKSFFKIAGIVPILAALCLPLAATASGAASVTLRWDPNTPAPEGYRAFARRRDQAFNYSRPDWEGSAVTCTLNTLEEQSVRAMRPLEGAHALDGSTPLFLNHPDPQAIIGGRRPGATQKKLVSTQRIRITGLALLKPIGRATSLSRPP